jgi:hypothetical protein
MGIEPKNLTLSLADSTPLAPVTRLNPRYQYPILDYIWTTNLSVKLLVKDVRRVNVDMLR